MKNQSTGTQVHNHSIINLKVNNEVSKMTEFETMNEYGEKRKLSSNRLPHNICKKKKVLCKPLDYFNLRIINKSTSTKSSSNLPKKTHLRKDFLKGNMRAYRHCFPSKENLKKLQIVQSEKKEELKKSRSGSLDRLKESELNLPIKVNLLHNPKMK